MKQNLKKWLALFLAITMVGTSGIFVNNTSLRASEEDPYTSESELAAAEAEIPVQETAVEETAQAEEPAAVEVAAPVEEAAPAEEPVAAEETVAAEEATPAEEPATDETAAVSTAETASASSTAEATASSEETELTDKEKAEASYTYDNQVYTAETADKSVGVTATLTDAKAVPDQATLRVTPVNSGSAFDAYLAALNAQAEEGKSYTSDNTIMYDVAFLLPKYDDNGKAVAGELVEYEPAAGSVKVKFDFRNDQLKNEIGAENPEDVEVAHLPLTDAAKEKADTTADNTNISQNDVNVENIADSKESVSDNAASVELNSLSIISFSNPDAAEAGIKLKVTINFENSANQTDPNATLPVNQYYLQIRDKNWQTTCVPLNGMDGDTSVNELVNGKIEVWLKGFPKSDGTYADFTVGDEYTLTLIALKKEKGITYRPTGTNIDQNDYDVVSVGDMAPGTTVSLESMPDKKNITANDNEVTITFKSGYSDQKSQKEMIGNEPFGYGIWANEFNQTGDHDIESSFAAGKYQLDKDNYVHPDLSNYPGSIMAGEISGSNLHMNIDDGTESQVTIYTPDANKVIADGATVDTSLTAQQIKDKISTQINTVASTADAMASKTTVKLKKDNQNNVSIDFSGFPENETIYVDADEIAGGQFNDKIRINKYPGQTIVFNINETNVALRQILVCNDGTGSTYTPIDMGTDKDLLDSVASHIIWNVPGSGAQVSVDNVAGTFIVPRGTFTIIITSSSGWIVANKVVAKAEWHNVNRHMPVPASSSITVKKKLEGGTLAADQFSFQLIDNKGNVLQTKKNDASGNVQFDSINYEKEGTYTYTIKEVKDSTDSTITYDDGVITVTVTVEKVGSADNYDYKITGVTYSKAGGVTTEGSNTFVNKKQQKGSLTVNKTFVKNGKTNTEYNDEIKVVISKTQLEEGTDADTNNTKTITIRNGEGSVTFDNLDLGSYYVYEVVDGKVTSKHAGYTVSGNENATTLSTSSLTGTVNLINTYSVTGTSTTLGVDKQILGRTVKDGDSFEFVLQADEKNPEGGATITTRTVTVNAVAVNPNDENTAYTLTPNGEFGIKFTKAGTYKFTVHETSAAGAGITNGDDVVVTYKVEDDGNGALKITSDSTGDKKTVTVTNTYNTAAKEVSFGISKTMEGRAAEEGEAYSFLLIQAADNEPGADITTAKVTMTADGKGKFVPDGKFGIKFTKAGSYTFTVTEQDSDKGGVTKAEAQTFTYTVKDNLDGTFSVTGGPTEEQKAFVNTYSTSDISASFGVDKKIAGRDVKADDSFSFELQADETNPKDGAEITKKTVTVSAVGQTAEDGKTTYTLTPDGQFGIKFTKAGTYKFTVHETSAAGAGITNGDDVVVTYKVEDDGNGALKITSDSTGDKKTVTVTNTYNTAAKEVSFGISKTMEGRAAEEGEAYSFLLTQAADNEPGADITTAKVTMTADGKGKFVPDGKFGIKFTKAGSYTFTVTEQDSDKGGVTKAEAQTFTYTVKDNLDGTFSVTGGPTEEQKAFVNTYSTSDISASFGVDKKIAGRDVKADDSFSFELQADETNPKDGAEITKKTVTVSAVGQTAEDGKTTYTLTPDGQFGIKFTKAGTYKFTVHETSAAGAGITNGDDVVVTYKVTDDGNGALLISKDSTGESKTVTVTNTYTAVETDASFGITKTLEGRIADKNDKFVFTMTAADTNPDGAKITNDTVTAKGQDDGTFTTDDKELSIHFSKPGDYTFTVAEQDTKEGGITLADPQTFTYHVEDNFKGALVVTGGPSKEQKAFVNTYNSKEVEANFSIDKQIAGRDVKADDSFSFELLADEKNPEGAAIVDGNVVASAVGQENADGQTVYTLRPDHSFSIKFTKEGTYKFKVHETSAAGNGIKNPEKDVVVTYKVRDDRNGNLVIKKDNLDENKVVTITNTYTAEKVKTSFGISKTLFGRDAEQNEEYTFKLTGDDKNPDGAKITNDTVKATAQDGSTFTTDKEFAISFTKPGDYTFTVTEKGEKAGITNADPQTFTYHVVDDMAGALVVTGGPSEEQKAFVNNFNARYAAARIRGTKKLDDTYGGKTLQAGQFRFELIDKNNKVVDSATNDENGNFVFRTRFFDKAGTYSYFVKEVNAGDRINGISYSDTTYPVSITVDEAQNGQLSIAGDPASVEITNKAFVNVTVSKQWKDNDNALGDRPSEITVHVYRGIAGSAPAELDASPIKLNENGWSSTLTNLPVTDENGNAYIYTVKEDAADNYRSEVTYDYSDGQITANLTNTRIGNIDLVANKKLVNAALKDGQFTFALFHKGEPVLDANGNAITAKNTASGTITFINVPYYSDGYTVREVKGTDDHITYDENEYPITVADGAQTGEAPTFTNTYRPIVLRVRKTSKQDGDPLVGSTYALYQKGEDGNDILVESQTSDANGYMYFKNITPGVLYFFKEVSAPAGHTVDPNPTPIFQAGYVDGNVIIYDENGNQMPETDYTLSSIEDATTEVQDKVDTLKTEDHAFSYSDGQITAVADALDANDPNLKEAKLVVKPLSGEEYDENYRTLVLKSGEIKDAILYDVSFVKDGKEVEPSEGNTITVTIQDANGLSTAGTDKDELTGTVKLIHISNGEVSVVGGSVGIANNKVNQMTVSSDSFSVFGSVLLGSTTNMGGNVMLTAHGVADKVTQLNVKKLDKDSLKPVAGAHLQIRYPDGTVVKDEQGNELDWVSTEQVKTFNRALDVNTEYVLHEVSAPDGYKTADDVHFTIDKFGYVTLLSGSDNAEASRDADTETIDSATLALKDAKMSVVETVTKTLFKHTSKEETVQGKDTVKYVSGTIVKSVQTGDTTQIALMIILLAAAGAALAALLAAKKRSSKK